MANRSLIAARTIQRKLQKIIKDLLKRDEIRLLLDESVEKIPAMNILINPDQVENYGEDVLQFKQDIETCIKFLSRMRGKRNDSVTLSSYFEQLLSENFPEVFQDTVAADKKDKSKEKSTDEYVYQSSKKRSRTAIEADVPEKTVTPSVDRRRGPREQKVESSAEPTGTKITTAQKNELRTAVVSLSKNPLADPFLYPVDSNAFPEYYEFIDNPMDLTTMKQKITSYSCAEDAIRDFRLIWDNCKKFNAEGSEIYNAADQLAALAEAHIEGIFGSEFAIRKVGRKKSERLSSAAAVTSLPTPSVDAVVEEPVEAPAEKRSRRSTTSSKVEQPETVAVQPPLPPPPTPKPPPPAKAPPPPVTASTMTKAMMKQFIKDLESSDFSIPFGNPVDPAFAPGYLDVIKHPMDLSTVKKRLKSGEYDSDSTEFIRDIRLIGKNCISYNLPNSEIAQCAEHFLKLFDDLLRNELGDKFVPGEIISEKPIVPKVGAPRGPRKHSESKPSSRQKVSDKDKEAEVVPQERLSLVFHKDLIKSPTTAEAKSASPVTVPSEQLPSEVAAEEPIEGRKRARKPKFSSVVELLKDPEPASKRYPLSNEAKKLKLFWKEITNHHLFAAFQHHAASQSGGEVLDLSIFKNRLHMYETNPPKLLADLKGMLTSFQKQNVPASQVSKDATVLSEFAEKSFAIIFPAESTDSGAVRGRGRQPKSASPRGVVKAETSTTAAADTPAATVADADKGSIIVPAGQQDSKYPLSAANIDKVLAELQSPSAAKSAAVREKATQTARQRLEKISLPWQIVPTLFTIEKFGEVYPWSNAHFCESIYPMDYCCSRKLRLCMIPLNDGSSRIDYVDVDIWSRIKVPSMEVKTIQVPVFCTTLANGTVISEASTPRAAWTGIFGKELKIVHLIGSRMRRCRAVFNRLSVSPDAVHFLEESSVNQPSASKPRTFFKPIFWLREIHTNLVNGAFESEMEFAWNMRTLFQTSLQYEESPAGFQIANAAKSLSALFESLFAQWVLNVQDRSVDHLASGQWDEWMHVRYFDGDGSQISDRSRPMCKWCGDDKDTSTASLQSDWTCSRCSTACLWSNNNMAGDPFAAVSSTSMFSLTEGSFNCEELGGICYYPVNTYIPISGINPESLRGWMQAKAFRRAELCAQFLSPFGFKVFGFEGILAQNEREESLHQTLLNNRIMRMQSDSSTWQGQHHTKPTFTSIVRSFQGENAFEPIEDTQPITLGATANFQLPPNHRIAFFSCKDEAAVLTLMRSSPENLQQVAQLLQDREELVPDRIPSGGFFGLDLEETISCIEGLNGVAEVYKEYIFSNSGAIITEMEAELKQEKKKYTNIAKGEDNLRQLLKFERWYWERMRLNSKQFAPNRSAIPKVSTGGSAVVKHQIGFTQLFPYFLSPRDGDILLCVWDFLESCKQLLGPPSLTLTELISSVKPLGSPVTTVGQIIFDEVSCMLSEFIFTEVRQRADIGNDQEWQDYIFSHPVNILTWPQIALNSIRLLSLPGTPSDLRSIMSVNCMSAETLMKFDILFLLFNHPHIDHFMLATHIPSSTEVDGYKIQDAAFELQSLRANFSAQFSEGNKSSDSRDFANQSVQHFASRVKSIFLQLTKSTAVEPVYKYYSKMILNWLTGLFHRKKISIESNASDTQLSEEDNHVAESVNKTTVHTKFSRYWGCHTLSNMEIPPDQLLIPSSFGYTQGNMDESNQEFDSKLLALDMIEKVTHMLSVSEPENFDTPSRIAVYSVLLDYCMTVKKFGMIARSRQDKSAAKFNELKEYVGYLPTNVVPVLEPATVSNKINRCIYTRIKTKNCPSHLKFVVVPKEYQSQPLLVNPNRAAAYSSTANNSSDSNAALQPQSYLKSNADLEDKEIEGGDAEVVGPPEPRQVVALEKALLRLISVREIAKFEQQKYESKLLELLQVLSEKRPLPAVADYEGEKPLSMRSMPLGYDRYGNSYWLLGAQECMTIFPSISMDFTNPALKPLEPCLLIRETNGWWGYHNGHDLKTLVSIMSVDIPCEKVLRECLLERLVFTKRVLQHGTVKLKLMQQEFSDRRARAEKWLASIVLSSNLTDAKKVNLLETVWARCAEVRMLAHYSLLYKYEDDYVAERIAAGRGDRDAILRRQKKLRETLQDESFDHHPTKGWLRIDLQTRIRELSTTLTATKVLADSSVFPVLENILTKSLYLKKLVPSSADSDLKPAVEEDESTDEMVVDENTPALAKPAAEQLLEKLYSKHSHTKCIEQLHLITGEVLRVYPSGKDAAQFMNVTQSGISLVTSGIRPDCYGFRWRIYEGPPIDFEAIKDRQTPLSELKKMQIMRGKPVNFNSEEEAVRAAAIVLSKHGSKNQNLDIDIEALKEDFGDKVEALDHGRRAAKQLAKESISSILQSKQQQAQQQQQKVEAAAATSSAVAVTPSVPKPDVVTSTAVLLPRLLRLKGELMNILFMLPTKRLQWQSSASLSPAEAEAEQASIEAAGKLAAQRILEGAEKTKSADEAVNSESESAEETAESLEANGTEENLEELAEEAAEKARRSLACQLGMDRFVRDVQQAVKPRQLFQLASQLEDAIPADVLFAYNKHGWDSSSSKSQATISDAPMTIAEVARRIFTIDRSICFYQLRGDDAADNAVNTCPYRLRVQFAPRCIINSRCKKFLCHGNSCVPLADSQNASRVPDGHDLFIATQATATATGSGAGYAAGVRPVGAPYNPQQQQQYQQQMQQQQYQRNDISLAEYIKRLATEKRDIDIETIAPYVPGNFELTNFEWV